MPGSLQRSGIGVLVGLLAMLPAAAALAASAAPDDPIRWRVRLIPEHRSFVGVWVDTRQLAPERAIESVTLEVECLDANSASIRSESFLFTDGARPILQRGRVYLRYFRHSCAQAHRIVGERLRYADAGAAATPGAQHTATLRHERIRTPSRQVELIGASPFRTTDPSAYCVSPLPAEAPSEAARSAPARAGREPEEPRAQ